jgi:hypothetical protein
MQRRQFLFTSLAASAAALSRESVAQTPAAGAREFYQIRRYQLQVGTADQLAESYFADALIPALTRMGIGPVGAFSLSIGQETPAYYSLIPKHLGRRRWHRST